MTVPHLNCSRNTLSPTMTVAHRAGHGHKQPMTAMTATPRAGSSHRRRMTAMTVASKTGRRHP